MKKNSIFYISRQLMLLWLLGVLFCTGCGADREFLLEEPPARESDTESPAQEKETPEENAATTGESIVPQELYVDVCGAVLHPGVYMLPAGSRIYQAIEAAGGFTEEAMGERINQAQYLTDEEQVYVPTREEVESQVISGPAAENQETTDGRVNINTADESLLMSLPGIGETRARAIIAYRDTHGGFSSVEEIMSVEGIKEGTFAKIKDQIVVR